jgi:hypothetical protein
LCPALVIHLGYKNVWISRYRFRFIKVFLNRAARTENFFFENNASIWLYLQASRSICSKLLQYASVKSDYQNCLYCKNVIGYWLMINEVGEYKLIPPCVHRARDHSNLLPLLPKTGTPGCQLSEIQDKHHKVFLTLQLMCFEIEINSKSKLKNYFLCCCGHCQ